MWVIEFSFLATSTERISTQISVIRACCAIVDLEVCLHMWPGTLRANRFVLQAR